MKSKKGSILRKLLTEGCYRFDLIHGTRRELEAIQDLDRENLIETPKHIEIKLREERK